MSDTPPDWALIEAGKRCGRSALTKQKLRGWYGYDTVFGALCDMILKHEQPPIDRKLLCAREASAQLDENGELDHWRSGDGDYALTCCLRSLALYDEGFGK